MIHEYASNLTGVNEDEVELCLELARLYDQGFPTLNHNHLLNHSPSERNEEDEKRGPQKPCEPKEIE
jgi:hypothetical protein